MFSGGYGQIFIPGCKNNEFERRSAEILSAVVPGFLSAVVPGFFEILKKSLIFRKIKKVKKSCALTPENCKIFSISNPKKPFSDF